MSDHRDLAAADIPWTSEPIAHSEEADVLMLDERELLSYCVALQGDCGWLRRLLHQAIETVATLTRRNAQLRREIESLRVQLSAKAR